MIGASERLDVAGFYFVRNCKISWRVIYDFFCVETAGFAKLLETFLCISCLNRRMKSTGFPHLLGTFQLNVPSYQRSPLVVFDFNVIREVLRLVLMGNVVKHHINRSTSLATLNTRSIVPNRTLPFFFCFFFILFFS